ncbi:MAG: hypothetical protein PHR44_00330 [Candidatus Omnitrophica bacterium]|nr:hypothetical protein [Candidatus Omnitrophota bacterium]
MFDKAYWKQILMKHFVQIFIGLVFYFYYAGYLASLKILNGIYHGYVFKEPILSMNVFYGIVSFLLFFILINLNICLHEFIRFLDKMIYSLFKKLTITILAQVVNVLIVVFLAMLIIRLLSGIFVDSLSVWTIVLVFLIFLTNIIWTLAHLPSSPILKYIKNRSFYALITIPLVVFLIVFPICVADLWVLMGMCSEDILKDQDSEVLTAIPLNLANEKKTPFGYLNKLKGFQTLKTGTIFLDSETKQLFKIRSQDVLRVITPFDAQNQKRVENSARSSKQPTIEK